MTAASDRSPTRGSPAEPEGTAQEGIAEGPARGSAAGSAANDEDARKPKPAKAAKLVKGAKPKSVAVVAKPPANADVKLAPHAAVEPIADASVKALPAALAKLVPESPTKLVPSLPEATEPKPGAAKPDADMGKSSKELVRELRRQRGRRLALRLFIFVVLPTLLAAVYYGAIASPQYESTTMFTIHSAERQQSLALVASVLGSLSSSPATHDTLAVRDYVLSRDMLRHLDSKYHLIAHYKDPAHDWLSRLSANASFEDAYEYYKDKVFADYDSMTGTLTLRVRAFTPNMAHTLAKAILDSGEKTVNDLTERERDDQIRFAEQDVATMEGRLVKARKALLALQQQHGEISPQHTAEAALGIRTAIQGEIAKARAELMQARAFMNPTAPQVVSLAQRVRALEAQAAQESARLVNPKNNAGVAETMGEFEAAAIEKEFAEKAYESARATLELARSDSLRQHRYLVKISEPSRPDESTYPRRTLGVLTVFLASFLIWGIGLLLVAAVREHAQV